MSTQEMAVCSEDDCTRRIKARGLCEGHYTSVRLAGLADAPCTEEGCSRPRRYKCSGLCRSHHELARRSTTACSAVDCISPIKAGGLCDRHYSRARRIRLGLPVREVRPDRCTVTGCTRELGRHGSRGLCSMHYQRLYKRGEIGPADPYPRLGNCIVDDCGRRAHALGLCTRHYTAQRRRTIMPCVISGCTRPAYTAGRCTGHYYTESTQPFLRRECSIKGCDRPHYGLDLCRYHWSRQRRNGDPTTVRAGGEQHWNWAGDEPSYGTAHDRVRRWRGSAAATECVDCGRPADDWSYNHTAGERELFDEQRGMPYSPNVDDYSPRCKPCHRFFDWRMAGPRFAS